MSGKTLAIALMLAAALQPAKSAVAACNSMEPGGLCSGLGVLADAPLCGSYSLSFSASVNEGRDISGSGSIISDCRGNLVKGTETITDSAGSICQGTLAGTYTLTPAGTGTASLSFLPADASLSCPIVVFTEAIAVAQHGTIVKAINTSGAEVTIQEEWVHQ